MAYLPMYATYDFPASSYRLLDQDFGIPMTSNDYLTSHLYPTTSREYYRPWKWCAAQMQNQLGSTIKSDKDKFVINVDVQHFAPEEITVKTSDGCVIIEAKHDEKKDMHGMISRHFTRRYALPEGTNPELVESKLSSDGVLTVIAPKPAPEPKNERTVPIAQTGPVRKEIKDTNQINTNGGAAN